MNTVRSPRHSIRSAALVAAVLAGLAVAGASGADDAPATRPAATQPVTAPATTAADADAAADRALAWLAKAQQPDGSWPPQEAKVGVAVTSLAVRAFLARGHAPGDGPYVGHIERGVDFVLAQQQRDGFIVTPRGASTSGMYEHGIAMQMLAEYVTSRAKVRTLREAVDLGARRDAVRAALARAVAFSLKAQSVRKAEQNQGGWRYGGTAFDSDVSVTGGQLAALRAVADGGVEVPAECFRDGRAYLLRCFSPAQGPAVPGGFTYLAGQGRPNAARTAIAVVSLAATGDPRSVEALEGGRYLLANPVTKPEEAHYYYAAYYATRAYRRLGGDYWVKGYPPLRDAMLAHQAADGNWPRGVGQEREAGDAYRTAMAVLALCPPAVVEPEAAASRPATAPVP